MPNPAEREVMALMLRTNVDLVASVLRGAEGLEGDASVMAAISATRSLSLLVEDTLHALVQQARAEGHTWAEVGELLHVTRQAAFARFAGSDTAAALDFSDMPPLDGAEQRARSLLDDFLQGHLEEARATFDDYFRERASLELLKNHRGRLEHRFGAVLEVGTAKVMVRDGFTVVDLPVAFEHGDMRNRTSFDVDGQVTGFGLHTVHEPRQ